MTAGRCITCCKAGFWNKLVRVKALAAVAVIFRSYSLKVVVVLYRSWYVTVLHKEATIVLWLSSGRRVLVRCVTNWNSGGAGSGVACSVKSIGLSADFRLRVMKLYVTRKRVAVALTIVR